MMDTTSWLAYFREKFQLVEDDAVLVTTSCYPQDFGLSNMYTYWCSWDKTNHSPESHCYHTRNLYCLTSPLHSVVNG